MDGTTGKILTTTGSDGDTHGAVLLAMCLAVLMAQVDTSVVNLAEETIGKAFHVPVQALQWVLDAYNLVYAVLLLAGGAFADLYGRRRVFRIGAAVLGIASVGCAAAPTIGILVAFRALAGLGAALIVPASLAIIRVVWEESQSRRRALGVWASCNGLAFVVGPTLGGLLIERLSWRSVFILAVPIAVAAFVLAGRVVPESYDRAERRLDLPGQVFAAAMLGALVFAAIASDDGNIVRGGVLALSIAAFGLFVVIERRAGEGALVPLDLFRQRPFRSAIQATAAMTFGIYGMIFLLPLLWQSSGFLNPAWAGVALVPCALIFFLVSQRSGKLAERFGAPAMIGGGTGLIGLGLIVLALTDAGHPFWLAQGGLVLAGIGMGLNTGPLMSVAVDAVSAARAGTASALINVARMVGATLGIAILGALFAIAGGGAKGLTLAMLAGGGVQLLAVVIVSLAPVFR